MNPHERKLMNLMAAAFFVSAMGCLTEPHEAIAPMSRNGESWQKRHAAMNARVAEGDVDLIFIGDSITQAWEGSGKDVWAAHYADRKAVNLGIGGDKTQHVLWRLENGNLEGIRPKAAVLMIGTNNWETNTAEEIGDGILAIVKKLRKKQRKMKILVLAIFPREEGPCEGRELLARASAIASKAADGRRVFYMDIGPAFLEDDGTLTREIMPDLLHLSPKGYQIWADSIEDKIAELLGEN